MTGARTRYLVAAALAVAVAASAWWSVRAASLVVDLSRPLVAITTGFTGSNLLLFGVTEGKGDIVVVVRGPARDVVVRRKERVAGVWVNTDEVVMDKVPVFYALAANRRLDEFLTDAARDLYQIGLDHLELLPKKEPEAAEDVRDFREALIRNKRRQGLYDDEPGKLLFLGNRLFRTDLFFPANVPVGTYGIDIYLFQDGEATTVKTTLLSVRKVGFEANVFSFAHRHSLAYGILAILMAAAAGWLASIVFRKSCP